MPDASDATAPADALAATDAVTYAVTLERRHAHLFDIEARFPVGGGEVDLLLPVWTPGSYLVREFARHVQDLDCDDGEGRPLPVHKIDKATWRVDARAAAQVRVRYRVYAWDLTVRSAHLDDSHGFFNGACLFLYVAALRARPVRVTVTPPAGWRVTVALDAAEPVAGQPTFAARDYDELVDSPFEIGTHALVPFVAAGKPHQLAVWGRRPHGNGAGGDGDWSHLVADLERIVAAAADLFGGELPYPDYTFLLLLAPNHYGGLEHARSSTLLASPFSLAPRKKYEELLELAAHEHFHAWNVKRIHPDVLGPFDYQREAYTRSLWVMEGFTSYYDRYLLVRAGIQKPERYLAKLADELARIQATPGRLRQSLEEASFDAWIKQYRPDENSANSGISYYLKGGVVALLLDLEIRWRSGGARSLDDVMRLLWQRYGAAGVGFPDAAVQPLIEEAAGLDLDAFFARHVRGRDELDHERLLATVGLRVSAEDEEDEAGHGHRAPWLGVHTREDGEAVVVTATLDGSPALAAGLYAGDQVLALDGFRVTAATFKERLAARRPGERVRLTLFRRDELREVAVTLAERPAERLEVAPDPAADETARARYRAWLGAPFPVG